MTDDDPELAELSLEDFPQLVAIARFVQAFDEVPWFERCGVAMTADEMALTEAYLSALGCPQALVAPLADWPSLAETLEQSDADAEWRDLEAQLATGLVDEAGSLISADELEMALTHVSAMAGQSLPQAAELAALRGGGEADVIRAATGAAAHACHQAALVLAAGGDDEHPFSFKFQLFEAGRWPLGIIGGSFAIF